MANYEGLLNFQVPLDLQTLESAVSSVYTGTPEQVGCQHSHGDVHCRPSGWRTLKPPSPCCGVWCQSVCVCARARASMRV